MDAYYVTDCGKVRESNEDAGGLFYNQAGQLLAIVADGMGGHQAGEVASDLIVTIAKNRWEETGEFIKIDQAESWLADIIIEANAQIYQLAQENDQLEGMGTTVVMSLCTNEFVVIGHVGDSRCYFWSSETKLSQMTSDHSLVNELVRTGQISPDDAEEHPRKNVLIKAIGTDRTIEPDIRTIEWEKEDRLLLCSDGLSNKIQDQELATIIESMEGLDETGKLLIDLANERGGEDNITLALVQHKAGEQT